MAVRTRFTITIEPGLGRQVDKLARTAGVNRSEMIEHLILDAIDNAETVVKATSNPNVMGALMKALVQPGVLRGLSAAMQEDLTSEQLKLFIGGIETLNRKPKGKK